MSLGAILALLLAGGWLFSKIFQKIGLPPILGMIIWGVVLSFFSIVDPRSVADVEPTLKSFALIVILLRAGLGLSKRVLHKAGITALLMAVVPCLFEGGALTIAIHYLFGFSWSVSGLTAFMVAAVSPAVIVPSMLEMKEQGIGREKEVPSIILAGASVDDVFAITLFSIFLGVATTGGTDVIASLFAIPISLLLGVVPGLLLGGLFVYFFPRIQKKVSSSELLLLLLCGAAMLVQIGDLFHSAALLGVMCVGLILLEKVEDVAHDMANKLKRVWIFAEIVLFVLIGLSVDLSVAYSAGAKGLLVIAIGLIFRSLGVLCATMGSSLNQKERLFCVIAYIPKATVQAALGSVAWHSGVPEGETILAIAVLSIVVTAPLGLLGIRFFGKSLLGEN